MHSGDGDLRDPGPWRNCLRHPAQYLGKRRVCPDLARPCHVRRLPAGIQRPAEPAVPLSLHQLHQLRTPLHHRARHSLRSCCHDHGRVSALRRLPQGIRGPHEPPLPRTTECLPGMRPFALRANPGSDRPACRRSDCGSQGSGRLQPGVRRAQRSGDMPASHAQATQRKAVRTNVPRPGCHRAHLRNHGPGPFGVTEPAASHRRAAAQGVGHSRRCRARKPDPRRDAPLHPLASSAVRRRALRCSRDDQRQPQRRTYRCLESGRFGTSFSGRRPVPVCTTATSSCAWTIRWSAPSKDRRVFCGGPEGMRLRPSGWRWICRNF